MGEYSGHRRIVEKEIGRALERWEIVHHKDHNPKNNAINNLMIVTAKEHAIIHSKGMNAYYKHKARQRKS